MITLQFSTTSSPSGALIRWATWSRHSHVEIVMDDGRLLGSVGHLGGVVLREPDDSARRVERYTVDAPAAVIDAACSQLGRPYDWTGILGWGLRRRWQDPAAWFCSELVAWAFAQGGRPLLRADHAWRLTPRDLLLSPLLQEVRGGSDQEQS